MLLHDTLLHGMLLHDTNIASCHVTAWDIATQHVAIRGITAWHITTHVTTQAGPLEQCEPPMGNSQSLHAGGCLSGKGAVTADGMMSRKSSLFKTLDINTRLMLVVKMGGSREPGQKEELDSCVWAEQ